MPKLIGIFKCDILSNFQTMCNTLIFGFSYFQGCMNIFDRDCSLTVYPASFTTRLFFFFSPLQLLLSPRLSLFPTYNALHYFATRFLVVLRNEKIHFFISKDGVAPSLFAPCCEQQNSTLHLARVF